MSATPSSHIPHVSEFARADLDGVWRVIVEPNVRFEHSLREFYSYHLKCFAAGQTPDWLMFQSLAREIRKQAKDRETFEKCARVCLALAHQNATRKFTFWPLLRPSSYDSIQPELLRDLRAQLRQTKHPLGKMLRRVYRYFVRRLEVGEVEPDEQFPQLRAQFNALHLNDSEGDEIIRLLYAMAEDDVKRRPRYQRVVYVGIVALALGLGLWVMRLLSVPHWYWGVVAFVASALILFGIWHGLQRVWPVRKNAFDHTLRFIGMAGVAVAVIALFAARHWLR